MQFDEATRNARLDAIETTAGTSPTMKLFGGAAMPGATATADAGTALATLSLPSDWLAAASGGTKSKSGTWEDTSADATGLARYFRVYSSGGTCRMQGLVGQNWQASTAYALGQHIINDSGKVYLCVTAGTSAGSGGPTGTSSGITDGSVSWNYVGTVDMTLVNTSLAATQPFSVSTFTLTEGNA
jgi:hypothetical protein